MKLTPNTGDYRNHAEGQIYQSNIGRYTIDEGDFGPFILLHLHDGVEDDTSVLASLTLSKRSKLGKIVKMLYPGYDFEQDFDLDMLIGMPVAVTFGHTQREDGGWSEKAAIVAKGDNDLIEVAADDTAPF